MNFLKAWFGTTLIVWALFVSVLIYPFIWIAHHLHDVLMGVLIAPILLATVIGALTLRDKRRERSLRKPAPRSS